jgi:Zn-finger nucleic acid-binding protein
MNCPKCRIEKMKPEKFEDIMVDRCPACQGIFFDRGELNNMITKKMGGKADTFAFSATSDDMDNVPAHCPHCQQKMTPCKGAGDIRVDQCQTCKSIFLDQGELASLQLYFP